MFISLSLYVISVFLPWFIEHSQSPLAIFPPFRTVSRFWSFQVVMDNFQGNKLLNSLVLRFQEYWFVSPLYASPERVFQGWLFVFVFQILGVIAGATSVVKEKVRGKPLPLICAITCSILTLVVCFFQLVRQSAPGRGHAWTSISFDIGFFLALISVILWLVSPLIDKLMKQS